LTGTSQLFFESGSTFNDSVTASAPLLYLNGSRFNGVAHLTNNGSSSVTSTGGCYFKKKASIYNSCSTSITYSFSTTAIDTFVTDALIQNNIGTLAFTKAVFLGAVTLKNANTTTGSDRYYVSSSGQTVFKGAVTIDNATSGMVFGNTSGILTLDSTSSLSFASGFTGNITIKGVTQLGNNAQNFTFPSASSKLILGPGNIFNGPFTYYGHYIQLNGSTFNSIANITRYGTGNDICAGGNVFNGTTVLRDSSGHSNGFYLANVTGDTYNGDVTFIQKGTSVFIYPSYSGNSSFAGNINVDGTSAITFGQNGGQSIMSGPFAQTVSRAGSYMPIFKKLKVNKANSSTVSLQTTLNITDSLILVEGFILSDSVNYITLLDNSIATSGSPYSFVEGYMKKVGNDAFTFPLGSRSALFHPLKITAPTNTSDEFLSFYSPTNSGLSNLIDSGEISSCEYWKIKQTMGSSSIKVTMGLSKNACLFDDLSKVRVAFGDSLGLKDKGYKNLTYDYLTFQLGSDSSISFATNKTYYLTNGQKHDQLRIQLNSLNDPLKARGMYVNKFYRYNSSTNTIDQANSILASGTYDVGSSTYSKEEELLQYAQKYHIEMLVCYDFRAMRQHNITVNGLTMYQHFARFILRAKNHYCLKFVGIAFGGGADDRTGIEDFTENTPAMAVPSFVTDFFGNSGPFNSITQTYSPSDPDIYQSEFYKTVIDAISVTGVDIDLIANEYEFWLQVPDPLKCTFNGGNPYSNSSYCAQFTPVCGKQPAFGCQFKTITESLNLLKIAYNANHPNQLRTALYSSSFFTNYSLGGFNASTPSLSRSPYDNSTSGSSKVQIILSASELIEKGYSTTIGSLAFNITSCTTPAALNNFTIKLFNTTETSYTSSNFIVPNQITTVYGPIAYTPIVGINLHQFSTPFTWDGTTNIGVEICFDNGSANPSNNARINLANSNKNIFNKATLINGACTSTSGTVNATGPNVMLNYNPLDITQFVDGITQTYSPSEWDVIFLAQYNNDSRPEACYGWGEYPQIHYAFQDSRTGSNTVIHPLLNAGSLLLGDDGNYFGTYFSNPSINPSTPMSSRNIFTVEKAFYDNWKADPLTSTNSSNKNIINPGIFHWFMSSYLMHYQANDPIIFQTNSPQCISSGQAVISFTYQGPLEQNIVCTLEVRSPSSLVFTETKTTPDYSTGNSISFSSCSLSVGEYIAKMIVNYPGSSCPVEYIQKISISSTQHIEAIDYSTTSPIEICEGTTVKLKASNISATGSYQWQRNGYNISGATNPEYAASITGVYRCSISYGTGTTCSGFSNEITITVNPKSVPLNIAVLCNGASTGVNLALVPYTSGTVNWSNGSTGSQINVTTEGYYSAEITTGTNNQCRSAASVTITAGQLSAAAVPSMSITALPTTSVFCQGTQSSSGSISLAATSGFDTYLWSTNENTSSITLPSAPAYTTVYTVLGAMTSSGCSSFSSRTISINEIRTTVSSTTNCSCFNGSNGSISAVTTGNVGTVTYSISPGSTTNTTGIFNGLSAGNYTITATDGSCSATATSSITQPTAVQVIISAHSDIICFGTSSGTITSSASGGTNSFTYAWSPSGGTGAIANNLSANTYTVTVTDGNGCTASALQILNGPSSALAITSIATTPATCLSGYSDGTATVYVSGGWGTNTYLWNNSSTTAIATGLTAGNNYSCTVTDLRGCSTSSSTISAIGSTLGFTLTTSNSSANCIGYSSDGQATVTPAPSGAFSYLWDNFANSQTTSTATNLDPGTYTVVVSSGSCSASATVTVANSTTYDFTNPTITTSTTWGGGGTYKVKGVVIVGSGGTLTIDNKNVEFTYELKNSLHSGSLRYYKTGIIVSPGGKLIVKGGSVLTGCNGGVWDGIQMNGDQNSGQTTAQPIVEIYEATIKNAYAGVCANSYDYFYPSPKDALAPASGGILHTYSGANFINNRIAILFPTINYNTILISTIDQTQFTYDDDSPFKNQFSERYPMVFINTSYNKGLVISKCTFTSSVSFAENLKGTGIKGFDSEFSVGDPNINSDGNTFLNLTDAIESNCSNSLSTNLSISENIFTGNLHSVTGNGFSFSTIDENDFNIPHYSGYVSWGCYILGSNGFEILKNTFDGPSNNSDPNFGVIINKSDISPKICENNIFSNLNIATQTEEKNEDLQIFCNQYHNNNISWYINPDSPNDNFNTQGDGINPNLNVRANNLFYDAYVSCTSGPVAIIDNANNSWNYYAWGYPAQTYPIGSSCTNLGAALITCSGSNTDPNSRCSLWRICNPASVDCIGDLKSSLSSVYDLKKRNEIIKEVIKFYLDHNSPDSLTSFLISISDAKASKILLEKYIKYGEYSNARSKLDLLEMDSLIESDFKSYNNVILDLLNDQLTIDSLTETQKSLVDSLKNNKSEISEMAKAIIEKVDYNYEPRVPEFPSLARRRNPVIQSDELTFTMRNYPNPFSNSTIIEISSYIDFESSKLIITNVLGEIIKSCEINAENTKFEIIDSRLVPGIYYYFIINKDGKKVLTKSMVVTN